MKSFPLSLLGVAAACASAGARPAGNESPSWRYLRARYDHDRDGRIEHEEYSRSAEAFHRLDADGDGVVSASDFDPRWDGVPRIAAAAGENGDRWIGMEDFVHGEGGPEVGEPAPPFRLVATNGEEIGLSAFHAKQPVALVFGSYT
jgi:hypothetical protein